WPTSISSLQDSLNKEKNFEESLLSKDLMKSLFKSGNITNPIAISNTTMNGMINLSASLSRIFTYGEEENKATS
ncbi:MAG: ATP/GTP-binding protein, partial [Candidatus Nitrosocosmicus sp.]